MPPLTEDSPTYDPLPWECAVTLKRHQRAALHRCNMLETQRIPLFSMDELRGTMFAGTGRPGDTLRTRIGILGDRVGSGKSFVLLSLVLSTPRGHVVQPDPVVKTYGGGRVVVTNEDVSVPVHTSLLVIPHNLCAQWEEYARLFSPDLSFVCVSRAKHVEALAAQLEHVDLVIVINTFYGSVAALLNARGCRLRRAMFDEADSMAIPATANVDASFYWFVSASYNNLISPHTRDLREGRSATTTGFVRWLFADFNNSGARDLVRSLVVRNDDAFVRLSMEFPDPETVHVPCRTPHSIRVLDGLVDRGIINCLNAGDIPGALLHVSTTNRSTEDNVVGLLIEKLSRQAKNIESRIALVPTLEYEDIAESEAEMQRLTRKLGELEHSVACIRERVVNSHSCCICYDAISNKAVAPCCSNAYCFGCISQWVSRSSSCPLCKGRLVPSDLLVVQDMSTPSDEAPILDKLERLKMLIHERRMSTEKTPMKLLVFSTHDHAFVGITEVLQQLSVTYRFLRGNHFRVRNIVEQYKGGDVDVLLVNPTHYGSGLNFENTTDIIMFHRVGTDVEKQVVGRALRMGRTSTLKIWHLLYDNET
jgi:hypothetical protein